MANIDWPKSPDDPVKKKKDDFIDILDFYQKMNFNASIVQVRTAGDALYPTDLAPWSRYLTGKEGEAPKELLSTKSSWRRERQQRCIIGTCC